MGAPLELPITRQLATILKRRLADGGAAPGTSGDWVFPSILPRNRRDICDALWRRRRGAVLLAARNLSTTLRQ